MKNFIRMEDVTKRYKSRHITYEALRDISLYIGKDEFVAIKGPSGSGKTTLLSILGTLLSPEKGRVIIDGIEVSKLSQERRADFRSLYTGFVFQHFHLLPFLTVFENIMLPLATVKKSSGYKKDLVNKALETVRMIDKKDKKPSEISGGEQQRVAIARAIVNEPPLILADEPTGNLDSENSKAVMDFFGYLNKKGHTIIFVTHDSGSAEYATRILNVKDGRITEGCNGSFGVKGAVNV